MKKDTNSAVGWYDQQILAFEKNRFGAMTLMMTAQSCWGSIAVMFSLKVNMIFLVAISAAVTMASNSAFIAQSPARWCIGIFYASIVTNLLIIIINLFV